MTTPAKPSVAARCGRAGCPNPRGKNVFCSPACRALDRAQNPVRRPGPARRSVGRRQGGFRNPFAFADAP